MGRHNQWPGRPAGGHSHNFARGLHQRGLAGFDAGESDHNNVLHADSRGLRRHIHRFGHTYSRPGRQPGAAKSTGQRIVVRSHGWRVANRTRIRRCSSTPIRKPSPATAAKHAWSNRVSRIVVLRYFKVFATGLVPVVQRLLPYGPHANREPRK